MRPIEIKDLCVGLLAIVFLSIAFGQYGKLQRFAAKEAELSLRGWKTYPFFPKDFDKKRRK